MRFENAIFSLILSSAWAMAGCGATHGDYEVIRVGANTCEVQPELGDTTYAGPSCGANALLDPDRKCNDFRVDFFLRMDSFPTGQGRKTSCALPDSQGNFACHAYNGHAWEGNVDPNTGMMTLSYARGTALSQETDYEGIAGLENIECRLVVDLRWMNQSSDWLEFVGLEP